MQLSKCVFLQAFRADPPPNAGRLLLALGDGEGTRTNCASTRHKDSSIQSPVSFVVGHWQMRFVESFHGNFFKNLKHNFRESQQINIFVAKRNTKKCQQIISQE